MGNLIMTSVDELVVGGDKQVRLSHIPYGSVHVFVVDDTGEIQKELSKYEYKRENKTLYTSTLNNGQRLVVAYYYEE